MPDKLFKIAFPVLTLPVDRGSKRAIVIMSMSPKLQPDVMLATCIDIDGRPHVNVPFVRSAIERAAREPIIFVETQERGTAPKIGKTGLVGPDGQPV